VAPGEEDRLPKLTAMIRAYLREMVGSDSFVDAIMKIRNDKVVELSSNDLDSYGLGNAEYMRRTNRASRECSLLSLGSNACRDRIMRDSH